VGEHECFVDGNGEKNMPWWEKRKVASTGKKAIAYYRHSAQDRQENSIPIQQDQVRKFAFDNGIAIIKEFQDAGKSGLSTKGRDGFLEMIEYVIDGKEEFEYVLVLDESRWGRFQNLDLPAYYATMCLNYGKQVIFTTHGFRQNDDLVGFLHLNIERYRAARYSSELSEKVFKGCVKVTQQGFRPGGEPPYALHRLLLDEKHNPVQILAPKQRKSIQNQRVTLTPGKENEVAVVRRIFDEFVEKKRLPEEIVKGLNDEGIPSPGGTLWSTGSVNSILTNELYIGTMVYNKTSQKLQSNVKKNPVESWIRQPKAFQGIIEEPVFLKAQEIIKVRKAAHELKYSPDNMLEKLKLLHSYYGKVGPRQIAANKEMVSANTYVKYFKSLDRAFQNVFKDVMDRTKQSILTEMKSLAASVRELDDYVVLNDALSVLIQPSIPVSYGYNDYWAFRPDPRVEVDITLGVPLSNNGQYKILGYMAFPRMLVKSYNVRLFNSSDGQLELYGYRNLDVIKNILS
jgi:DNA invertase Pin-like site-specific DNA recombinase